MFAVIKTGGKQYKVATNDILRVEKLSGNPGETIKFSDVLIIEENGAVQLGTPLLANTTVEATVLEQIRDDKVIIFKKNRRHNYRRKNGHRQYLTLVQITGILPEGKKPLSQKSDLQEAIGKAEEPPVIKAPKSVRSTKKSLKTTPVTQGE